MRGVSETKPVLAIAGATGFVGRALAKELAEHFQVVGISRGASASSSAVHEWRQADLFDEEATARALSGADYAIYLVHSMMPSARLTQARFEDLDLLCADNFGRAASRAGVKQIVYLGGLVPDTLGPLSTHLKSRAEMELALGRYGVPVTVLRAGLVIGGGGSSFDMMLHLVRRLPVMICPAWTSNVMQPIAADDVVRLLTYVVAKPECFGQVYDVGVPERLSYRQLMQALAEQLGLKRRFVPVPWFSPELSTLWVVLVTQTPAELVGPLVQSLRHDMLTRDQRLVQMAGIRLLSIREAFEVALKQERQPSAPSVSAAARPAKTASLVRSVQRMQLPIGRDAEWAANEYMRWLPRALRGLFVVEVDADRTCRFLIRGLPWPLLVLSRRNATSTSDQQIFDISGGLLAVGKQRGRFELRQVLNESTLMTAIHDFAPRLPWAIYRLTQALMHGWVMSAFRKHLSLPSLNVR